MERTTWDLVTVGTLLAINGRPRRVAALRVVEIGDRVDKVQVTHEALDGSDQSGFVVNGCAQAVLLSEHYASCGGCGALWPCEGHRADQWVQKFSAQLDRICAHCGTEIGEQERAHEFTIAIRTGELVPYRFHDRAASGCREAAKNFRAAHTEAGELWPPAA